MNKSIKKARPRAEEVQKYKDSIRVIKMAESLNAPEVKEVISGNGKDFVQWGEDNDYYENLILRHLGSPTNNRCINGICDLIYGNGLEATIQNGTGEEHSAYFMMKKLFNSQDLMRVIQDLKKLGQGMAQVVYNKEGKIVKFIHTPTETWRAAKAVDGVIKKYYYHPNWKKYNRADKLKSLPTFGNRSGKEMVEIMVFRPYTSGFYYYSPVDYHGCIQYCELEEEVSNYHINNVQNGMQPSMIVNFNNGVPPEETQELLEQKILEKFSGTSNAGRAIIAFNDDKDSAAEIEPIHLPDAHAQYQFLSDEAREKIMLGHGVVSPILLGIKDNTGFGNNAEELRTSSILMDNMVIRPFQNIVIDGLKQIMAVNGKYLNMYFKTLQPIEFTDVDKIATKIRREEETGEKLSSHEEADLTPEEKKDIIAQLKGLGERINEEEWELVHTEKVIDCDAEFKMPEKLSSISSDPDADSSQDQDIFKVRYAYMPVRNSADSRDFCSKMELLTSDNVVFRKEDINMMSFRGVNRSLGHKRRNYSLFKYKGGKNCHHFWELRVYRLKVDGESRVSSGNVSVDNPTEVEIRPIDMPGKGAYIK